MKRAARVGGSLFPDPANFFWMNIGRSIRNGGGMRAHGVLLRDRSPIRGALDLCRIDDLPGEACDARAGGFCSLTGKKLDGRCSRLSSRRASK